MDDERRNENEISISEVYIKAFYIFISIRDDIVESPKSTIA